MSDSFIVLVEYQVRAETTTRAQWLEVFAPRARAAWLGEPDTLAYEAMVAEDATQVLCFERYRNRAALEAHTASPAHAALVAEMAARRMTKRMVLPPCLLRPVLRDAGFFWTRGGDGNTAPGAPRASVGRRGRPCHILSLRIDEPGHRDKHRDKFLSIVAAHARWVREHEPGTLVYGAATAVTDVRKGDCDVKKGDLIFVLICADRDAMRRHTLHPQHKALKQWMRCASGGRDVFTRTFSRRFATTGLGFLHRTQATEAINARSSL